MGRVKIGLSFIRLLNALKEEKRFITIDQLFLLSCGILVSGEV